MMRGVTFLFDEHGKNTAVMIDLRQGRGLWEDILDVATARPRGIPKGLASPLAIVGDMATAVTGRGFPLTTQRLKALLEASVFPCDKLVAAGFRHPQTTREGPLEMLAWMGDSASFTQRQP